MKKKLIALLLVLAMVFSMTACGNSDVPAAEPQSKEEGNITRPATKYDNSTLDGILTGIETDFADSIKFLQDSFMEVNNAIGDTYEGYKENKQVLLDWYELVLSEEAELMKRTKERAVEYLKLISSSIEHEDDALLRKQWTNTMTESMMELWTTFMMMCTRI